MLPHILHAETGLVKLNNEKKLAHFLWINTVIHLCESTWDFCNCVLNNSLLCFL